jgi:serine/threonine protein kinase
MQRPDTCNPELIERFLDEQLNRQEQASLEAHLTDCPSCRQVLEQRAADPCLWQAARSFLASDPPAKLPASGDPAEAGIENIVRGLNPTDDPRMLGRLGPYEIVGVVGCGGMGVVLKGFDAALDRYVAIKVLAPHLATSGSARRRFAREARAAAAVVHENVVAIHAVAEGHDPPYFVMPYVRGASLEKRLREQGPLGTAEVLRIARQIAEGLAAAHAQGLVHRDIKPANILLAEGVERLQITDFGLARAADDASLTRTGVIAGTPQYMSPEQARGEAVDARSDLFSLGSLMYAMCTGRPPFRADTSYGVLQRINHSQPRPIREINPEIPEWLEAIVLRLHAKDPAERFPSAEEVARLLQQCLAHVQQPATVPLPADCNLLSPADHGRHRSGIRENSAGSSMANARSDSARSWATERSGRFGRRSWLRAAAVMALLAVLAVSAALLRGPSANRHTLRNDPQAGAESNGARHAERDGYLDTTTGLQHRSAETDPRWHDGIDSDLSQLQRDIEHLQSAAARPWDTGAALPIDPSLPTRSPIDEEIEP